MKEHKGLQQEEQTIANFEVTHGLLGGNFAVVQNNQPSLAKCLQKGMNGGGYTSIGWQKPYRQDLEQSQCKVLVEDTARGFVWFPANRTCLGKRLTWVRGLLLYDLLRIQPSSQLTAQYTPTVLGMRIYSSGANGCYPLFTSEGSTVSGLAYHLEISVDAAPYCLMFSRGWINAYS